MLPDRLAPSQARPRSRLSAIARPSIALLWWRGDRRRLAARTFLCVPTRAIARGAEMLALSDTLTAGRLCRTRRRSVVGVAVLACLLSLSASAAAAPPNDNFADATEITGLPAEATGSTVDATREPDEPVPGEGSIWFKWTAPTDGGVTVVLGGCAPPFQESVQAGVTLTTFVKSAIFGIVRIEHSFHATAGHVYWIAVTSQPPDPDICFRLVPGPANDDFAQATPLTGFPASATQTRSTAEGSPTREFGEPEHNPASANTTPAEGSVWYSWMAPADRLVTLRACAQSFGVLAVYTGSRVDALTWVATRRALDKRCGSLVGASVTFRAAQGEAYRIAVTSPGSSFQLLLGNQVAVIAGRTPAVLYTAFPGHVDNVKLRLTGSGEQRALLLEAGGIAVANGCEADVAAGRLRCPVPGEAAVAVDVDLGDGHDAADVRLLGPVRPSSEGGPLQRVLGGDGNDTLAGAAGSYSLAHGWAGGLALVGGPGADRVAGGPGDESLSGGPGPDKLDPGKGSDSADGGPGDDRVWARDGASDSIRCQAGRDRARIDGIDLPQRCERRKLTGLARAVATSAAASNDYRESDDHLEIYVACPIDVKGGCRSRVTPAVPGERRISRRLTLAPGRAGRAEFYRFNEDQLVRRGVRVTVTTRRGGRRLKFTDHLAVPDVRDYGE